MKLLPIPQPVYQELMSGLAELDFAYGKTAETVNARIWLKALRDYCETLPVAQACDVPVSEEPNAIA